jgi:acetate---CoA ligase (ADP-forming)
MREFFCPSSVAVIGVSTRPMNLGKEIARNLFEFSFDGIINLVGAEGGVIFGRKIHASVEEISDQVDLAVILTPAKTIPGILEQCGRKGVRRVIIESGGFGEFNEAGHGLGEEVKTIVAKYDMRLIGPNCIGIMNSSNGLATPFAALRDVFPPGGVGIIAQSGGVALSLLNMFDSEQIGFSKFAAIGNKLNCDESDFLEYYIEDPKTSVICVYLESIKDGRRLCEIGRNSPKPIVMHKANIGSMSRVIAQSHTEALANDNQVVDAAFQQVGIVRFREMQTYLDFVKILQLPSMKGRNLAIVSRSGGHAVMAADAAATYKFKLPPFKDDFLNEIKKHLRANVIRLTNPLDLGDLFDFDVYSRIIEHTLQQEEVDGVLFMHTYFAAIEGESSRRLLHRVDELSAQYGKPIAVCVSTEQFELSRLHRELDFPIFMTPGRAVRALDTSIRYRERKEFIAQNSEIVPPDPAPDDETIQELINRVKSAGRPVLLHEALEVIGAAGLDVADWKLIVKGEAIERALETMPGPYALKIDAEGVSHKSDLGGVMLGLADGKAVGEAHTEMVGRFRTLPEARLHGAVVQKMAGREPGTYELIIGGKRDPQFGPVVLVGHGGVLVEIFDKTSLRMAPLSIGEIEDMIEQIPGSDIFNGVRGLPPINRDALVDAILRVSYLMVNFPEIDQIDVNPILVSKSGAQAVDARIYLRP